ncbi:MAG: hypothetical protein ACR2P0_13300 [Acidimicrobiales bacterium]
MGQLVSVIESPSQRPGIVRFITNRALSGMGHERYVEGIEITGDRPVDELARRLINTGQVAGVAINGNVITVELSKREAAGLKEVIEDLYTYYVPGVEIPSDEELIAQAEG